METNKGRDLTVTIYNDGELEDPTSWGCSFKVVSFNKRHRAKGDPSDYFTEEGEPTEDFAAKLDTGTAWILSYYEHGGCVWSFRGTGPQCQWDSVNVAGVLLWQDAPENLAKTPEEREKRARVFLETYTCWANGEGFGYNITETKTLPCGHTETVFVDSCSGFYGNDREYMLKTIAANLAPEDRVSVVGDCADVGRDLVCPKEVTQ